MPQSANAVLVLIASPSDATEERAGVRDRLNDWNIARGRREKIALLPWLWERHAVAKLGGRPQAVINAQAVDRADVVIAFFDSRLGTSTGVDVSGTAEEINRAADIGKPVHVYFSDEPLPRDVNLDQIRALSEFKADMEKRGIMGSYVDPADLAGQVVRAIESDIDEAGWGSLTAAVTGPIGADLHWKHRHEEQHRGFDNRGNPTYRTTANALIVRNEGAVAAEDLTFEVTPVGDTEFNFTAAPTDPFVLHPRSEMAWLLIPTPHFGSSGRTVNISASWREGETVRTETRTVTLGHS